MHNIVNRKIKNNGENISPKIDKQVENKMD